MLKLKLKRIFTNEDYTIGRLYINGEYFCDTIEDRDRNLKQEMSEIEIENRKVYGKTAIPTGTYEITLKVKSPKYSDFTKYKWAKPYNGYIPRLLEVKGYDGILIHVANTAEDVLGCIGVGENKEKGKVINSTATINELMKKIYELNPEKDNFEIEIIRNY